MKLVKLSATALTITFVATVLIKADQFLSRDPLTQKEKDPVRIDTSEVIEKEEINTDEIEQQSNESLLIEKIEKLTSRINELEAELINQQAEEEALKVENELNEEISNEEEEALDIKQASINSNDEPAPKALPVLSDDLLPKQSAQTIEPELPSFSPDVEARHDFGEALEPYGNWMHTHEYGDVWKPRIQNPTIWAPYTVGRWHYTELGWHFTSSEPWGWACYHYGRWVRFRTMGWCWVPGREWAPAWVSWRTSPRHIGWSPLPPSATWNHLSGIRHWADSKFNIGPSHYNFLRVEDFNTRSCQSSLISRRQNTSLMLSTNNVTLMFSISLGGRKRICNRGPDRNYLTRHHHQDHRPLRITRNRGERGCVNQVNVINQEIVIHQRVENQTNINLSKSKNIITVDNEEIDRGWNGVKTQEQRNLVRRHIVSDSRRPRNSNVVDVTKSKAVTDLNEIEESKKSLSLAERKRQALTLNKSNQDRTTKAQASQRLIEEQKKSLSLAERKRQALTLNKSNQDRSTKAQTAQKQIEYQRTRTILQERQKLETAQRKAEEEKAKQVRDAQKQIEEQRARTVLQERQKLEIAQRKETQDRIAKARASQRLIEEQKKSLSLAERKRQALTLNKSNQDRSTKAQTAQKQIEYQRTRTILQERQKLETAQRKEYQDRIARARAAQRLIEEQKKSISLAERKRQALSFNKYQQNRGTKAQTTQKQIEDQRMRTTLPYRKQPINNSTSNIKNSPKAIKGLSKIERFNKSRSNKSE